MIIPVTVMIKSSMTVMIKCVISKSCMMSKIAMSEFMTDMFKPTMDVVLTVSVEISSTVAEVVSVTPVEVIIVLWVELMTMLVVGIKYASKIVTMGIIVMLWRESVVLWCHVIWSSHIFVHIIKWNAIYISLIDLIGHLLTKEDLGESKTN